MNIFCFCCRLNNINWEHHSRSFSSHQRRTTHGEEQYSLGVYSIITTLLSNIGATIAALFRWGNKSTERNNPSARATHISEFKHTASTSARSERETYKYRANSLGRALQAPEKCIGKKMLFRLSAYKNRPPQWIPYSLRSRVIRRTTRQSLQTKNWHRTATMKI